MPAKGASPPLDSQLSSCSDTSGGDRMAACGRVAVGSAKGASPPLDSQLSSCSDTAGGDRTAACGRVAVGSAKGGSPPLDSQLSSCSDTCQWLADMMYFQATIAFSTSCLKYNNLPTIHTFLTYRWWRQEDGGLLQGASRVGQGGISTT